MTTSYTLDTEQLPEQLVDSNASSQAPSIQAFQPIPLHNSKQVFVLGKSKRHRSSCLWSSIPTAKNELITKGTINWQQKLTANWASHFLIKQDLDSAKPQNNDRGESHNKWDQGWTSTCRGGMQRQGHTEWRGHWWNRWERTPLSSRR